ncbi:Myb-related protein 3R-1 [Smittium culicis]|uniref:Myb-related protein 3R-1 n=1 Tax=Smittium culicis TaxID=133412 RepID=A0A1R1YTX7_9FUNG|nr:Myb-related protein 3R-1 [Smittium culicis]
MQFHKAFSLYSQIQKTIRFRSSEISLERKAFIKHLHTNALLFAEKTDKSSDALGNKELKTEKKAEIKKKLIDVKEVNLKKVEKNSKDSEQPSISLNENTVDLPIYLKTYWKKSDSELLIKLVEQYGTNWKKIQANFKKSKSTSDLCLHYHHVANPKIKKGRWSKTEDDMLKEVIKNYQHLYEKKNWPAIANMLGTGRSSLSVYSRHNSGNSVINGTRNKKSARGKYFRGFWSNLEDKRLLTALDIAGSRLMLKDTFITKDDLETSKLVESNRGFFTNSEILSNFSTDAPPKDLNSNLPDTSITSKQNLYKIYKKVESIKLTWDDISNAVATRSPSQCRLRWVELVYKLQGVASLKQRPFSNYEHDLLKECVEKHGFQWSKIRIHFPDRTPRTLRHYYKMFIEKSSKPQIDITKTTDSNTNEPIDSIETNSGLLKPNYYKSKSADESLNYLMTKSKKWSKEEIDTLLHSYRKYNGDWILISKELEAKLPSECLKMYNSIAKHLFKI